MAIPTLQPGFRFHPTDVELIMYYLKRKVLGKKLCVEAIRDLNIYKFTPWDLPDKSCIKSNDRDWYFFCPTERKYAKGGRMNRTAEGGYWKTTGKDRSISYEDRIVGMLKTLIFHKGHPPRGERTDWVMHEYRMQDQQLADAEVLQDAFVICKLFHKDGLGPRNGAQYGATFNEEEWDDQTPDFAETSPLGIVLSVGTTDATQLLPSISELPNMGGSEILSIGPLAEHDTTDCGETFPSGIRMSAGTAGATELFPSTSELTNMSGSEVLSVRPLAVQDPPSVPEEHMGILLTGDVDFESLWASVTEDDIPTDLSNGHEKLDNSNLGNPVSALAFSENDAFSNLPDICNWTALGGSSSSLFDLSEVQPFPDSYLELDDLNKPLHLADDNSIIEHMFSGNYYYNGVPSLFCYNDPNVMTSQYCSPSTQIHLHGARPSVTGSTSSGGGLNQNCSISTHNLLHAAGPNFTWNPSGGGMLSQNCSVSTPIPLLAAIPNFTRNPSGDRGLNQNCSVSTHISLPAAGSNFSVGTVSINGGWTGDMPPS